MHKDFCKNGNFIVSRTSNIFSSMGLQQMHDRLTKGTKGCGSMTGIKEDEEKRRYWKIRSPETPRIAIEFESETALKQKLLQKLKKKIHHHEDSASFHTQFSKHTDDLSDELSDLVKLGARDIK